MDGQTDGQTDKGHGIIQPNVGGVTVLVLCTSSDSGLYFYKVS